MRIDRSLNLVMEIPREGAPPVVVHATAMPTEIFEQYFDLCGPAYHALLSGGYGSTAPRYAALMFKKMAAAQLPPEPPVPNDAWNRAKAQIDARVKAFFDELHRLTYVLMLHNGKWDMVLVDDALAAGAIDSEEMNRIDGAAVFFTVTSQSVPREIREVMLAGLNLLNARTESSSCTEFMRSLPTSMTAGSSGENRDSLPASSSGQPERDSRPSSDASRASIGNPPRPSGIATLSVLRAG